MIAWLIIIVLLLLFLILPVGADAAYEGALFTLKAKAGPVRIQILPKKERPPKEKKTKKEKPKAAEEHERPKQKLTFDDILELARLALKTLSRFRKSLSIDVFMLHAAVAAEDPCDAVLRFGYLNAGLTALSPPLHRVLKIREEDIQTCVDFEADTPQYEARVVATLQIWEILYIAFCALFAFLRWDVRRKRLSKREQIETKEN